MNRLEVNTQTGEQKLVPLTEQEIAALEALKPTQDELKVYARNERNRRLAETDWMALSDMTLTPEWAAYRQALRDVPQEEGFPENVTWPPEPTTPA